MGYKLKKIYVGDKQVFPERPKTFTISWTEKSNMSSGWTYSDDATGLTAGSTAFDDFFGYSAVLLGTDGKEKSEVNQSNGVLNISSLGTLTGTTNNVMIKFPMRGIKMTKSGSKVTLSITEEPNKSGYQYYAFTKGGVVKDNMYLGAFKCSLTNGTAVSSSGTIAKSWATKSRTADVSPMANKTISVSNTYCANNGTGYSQIAFFQRMYVNALYMMKYGNPAPTSIIGYGYVGGNQSVAPGTLLSTSTNATYGSSSTTVQSRLFGLEDWWGNLLEWVDGIYTDYSRTVYVATDNSSYSNSAIPSSVPSNYTSSGVVPSSNLFGCASSIGGTNTSMFIPNAVVSNTSYNTYYCFYCSVVYYRFAFAGFGYSSGTAGDSGLYLDLNAQASNQYANCGSRLMYL